MPIDVVKCFMVKDSSIPFRKSNLVNPQRVNELIKTLNLDQCPQEQFWVICCDTKLKPTCVAMVGQGTNNSSEVDIKAIGRYALLSNSNALILVHNHPSGNNEPSPEDIETTRHIIQAMQLFQIQVVDHIIVGDDMFSFSRHKLL